MIDPSPIYSPFEIQDFETWFAQEQFPVELKAPFLMGWEAAIRACSERINLLCEHDAGLISELSTLVDDQPDSKVVPR